MKANIDKNIIIECDEKYDDEFYDNFVNHFVLNNKKRYLYLATKRFFDIIISFTMLVILFLPLLIVGIIVKIETKSSAIFKGRRVGKNYIVFNCWKFRSMRPDAPKEEATSLLKNSEQYITKFGHILRKTSVDELPQLVNVLTGKMSLIGYRPLITTEINCNELRKKLGVFRMKPGISGYSQVMGRDDVYYKNKALMDAYYVNNASLLFDLKIIWKSITVVMKGKSNWDDKKENPKNKSK